MAADAPRLLRGGVCLAVLTIGAGLMTNCASTPARQRHAGTQVIAHRGANAYAPENTLAAFKLAYEMDADWFELDCTLSQDDQVVVIHDDTTERTSGHAGSVADQTLAELKRLDVGAWKGEPYRGEPIPTLEETLAWAKKKIGVYIEIKNSDDDEALKARILEAAGDATALSRALRAETMRLVEVSGTRNLELTRRVIALVRQHKMERDVVIQSFSPIVCAIALIEAPELRVELLTYDGEDRPGHWDAMIRWGYLLEVHGLNPNQDAVDLGRLDQIQTSGKTVAVWTVNERDDIRRLAAWGVDAIITDRPDFCLETLREMGRHP